MKCLLIVSFNEFLLLFFLQKERIIEKPLELPDWNLSCLRRVTADHLKDFCLFTFLVCRKIESPNLTTKRFDFLV